MRGWSLHRPGDSAATPALDTPARRGGWSWKNRSVFSGKFLPTLLAPRDHHSFFLACVAGGEERISSSGRVRNEFRIRRAENYRNLFSDPLLLSRHAHDRGLCGRRHLLLLSIALALAVQTDRGIKGATAHRTLLVWPYAVARPWPASSGIPVPARSVISRIC